MLAWQMEQTNSKVWLQNTIARYALTTSSGNPPLKDTRQRMMMTNEYSCICVSPSSQYSLPIGNSTDLSRPNLNSNSAQLACHINSRVLFTSEYYVQVCPNIADIVKYFIQQHPFPHTPMSLWHELCSPAKLQQQCGSYSNLEGKKKNRKCAAITHVSLLQHTGSCFRSKDFSVTSAMVWRHAHQKASLQRRC